MIYMAHLVCVCFLRWNNRGNLKREVMMLVLYDVTKDYDHTIGEGKGRCESFDMGM